MQGWWSETTYQGDASRPSKKQTFYDRMFGEPYFPVLTGGTIVANGLSDNTGAWANFIWGDTVIWQAKTGVDWRRVDQFHREVALAANGINVLGKGVLGIPDSSTNDFGIFASGTAKLTD